MLNNGYFKQAAGHTMGLIKKEEFINTLSNISKVLQECSFTAQAEAIKQANSLFIARRSTKFQKVSKYC